MGHGGTRRNIVGQSGTTILTGVNNVVLHFVNNITTKQLIQNEVGQLSMHVPPSPVPTSANNRCDFIKAEQHC